MKAGEFSFVLRTEKEITIETVTNDAAGKITFSNHLNSNVVKKELIYHVREIRGTDSGIEYDKMDFCGVL